MQVLSLGQGFQALVSELSFIALNHSSTKCNTDMSVGIWIAFAV